MSFLLAHISDAHIGPLPHPLRRELMGKRLTGYINWRRGRDRLHDMDVLARLVADMREQRPDHIAMTGDVLNIGLPAEFPLAKTWLETLGNPRDVSFVPGNHDAYVRGSIPHLISTFAPWTTCDVTPTPHAQANFPYVRVRGAVALIGLSSGTPTAPFIASGRLGSDQREAFVKLLRASADKGLARVVMIHHPPHRAGSVAGRGLSDARDFEGIIRRNGAELIVHGHNHRSSVMHIDTRFGRAPVVGVASASAVPGAVGHRAAYHLFRIEHGSKGWKITARARGLQPGTRDIGELPPPALDSV